MPDITVNRPLAGSARNYLDDIRALNQKIPQELERGVKDGYLEADRINGLAEKLGVPAPRIKTRRFVYFESRQIHSYAVDAYDEADAIEQATRVISGDISGGNVPYGVRRSHWTDVPQERIVSELTATRPEWNHELRFYGRDRRLMDRPGTVIHEAVEAVTQEQAPTMELMADRPLREAATRPMRDHRTRIV